MLRVKLTILILGMSWSLLEKQYSLVFPRAVILAKIAARSEKLQQVSTTTRLSVSTVFEFYTLPIYIVGNHQS